MTATGPRIVVVGAGWAGATAARVLHERGYAVEVMERSPQVGGHSRSEILNGVIYEPNGAHIFHTSNVEVAEFVIRFGMSRPYQHSVLTEIFLDDETEPRLLSWPPQIGELKELPIWPVVENELQNRSTQATGSNFEEYVISLMGRTLYDLFIRDYTLKQWDMPPTELSSSVAPRRIELRNDGNRRLFRDRWEFFPPEGVNSVIESMLTDLHVALDTTVTVDSLDDFTDVDGVVVTAPLDEFAGESGSLGWRGISMRSRYVPVDELEETVTPSYVVNHPSLLVPYTRTVETKHASGQLVAGTVVSEEHPGSPARHYPIPTVDDRFDKVNMALKVRIKENVGIPVFFCGRLANYVYINQDTAIEQGFACADEVCRTLPLG